MNQPDPTAVDRIPLAHSIRYVARGLPEVPNKYGDGVLAPSEITLTYRAAEDSQLGRVHAYVAGRLWVNGAEIPLLRGGLYGQHYDGADDWPEWLAEEARLHDPEPAVQPPADPTALRERIAAMRDLLRGMALSLATGSGPLVEPSAFDAALDDYRDAVLAVLPEQVDRAVVRAEAFEDAAKMLAGLDPVKAALAGQHAWNDAAGLVRRMAVQERRLAGEQPECAASTSGNCLAEAQSETACDTDEGECVHGGRPAGEQPTNSEAQPQPGTETPHVRAARYAAAGNEMAASLVRDGFGDDEITEILTRPATADDKETQ